MSKTQTKPPPLIETVRQSSINSVRDSINGAVKDFRERVLQVLHGATGVSFDVPTNEIAAGVAAKLRAEGFESFVSHRTVFVYW